MSAVFISHRGADAIAAERLGTDLRERGHEVWLDAWEIRVGDSIVEKISSGLERTSHLVLCYSAAGMLAPWMNREWMAALEMQLNGHGIRLLPVRLTGGQPPALLADIRYADLVTDWGTGLAELSARLASQMTWKVVIAHAPGEEALAERIALPLQQAGYLASHRGTVLVGESFSEEADKALSEGGPVVLCATVQAVGTGWAHRLVNAARARPGRKRLFVVRMEESAYIDQIAADLAIAEWWRSPEDGSRRLIEALRAHYPLQPEAGPVSLSSPISTAFVDRPAPDSDIDPAAVESFRSEFRESTIQTFPPGLTDIEFLRRAGLMRQRHLTLAGALLFSVAPANVLPCAITHFVIYRGPDKAADREPVEVRGTIPEQIKKTRDLIAANIHVRERSSPHSAQAEQIYEYPMRTVREIIANALVHRDYEDSERFVHVRLFNDHIEVSSPGPWVGRPLPADGHPAALDTLVSESIKRNLSLATAIAWIRLVEGEGSGLPTAVLECQKISAPIPDVRQVDGFVLVTIWPRTDWTETRVSSLAATSKHPLLPLPDLIGTRVRMTAPEPRYEDERSRQLGEKLAEARRRLKELTIAGQRTEDVREQILQLRRELRGGGRLQPGDCLGEGRFQFLEIIGRGGFATVWKTWDEEKQEIVAIKVLHGQHAQDRSRQERFFRGARKMAELHHSGIVRVLEKHLEEDGHHAFVMEYVEGGDLRAAVLSGKLAQDRIIPLILKVGEALSFAHSRGIVHRDVKPANILLEGDRPKLTDFDLVRAFDTTGGTQTQGHLGTFLYTAPEVHINAKEAEAAADTYSLAMTTVFAFYGSDLSPDVWRRPEVFMEKLPCPEIIREVLRRGIAWEPEERPGSMIEFCRALQEGMELSSVLKTSSKDVPSKEDPQKKR